MQRARPLWKFEHPKSIFKFKFAFDFKIEMEKFIEPFEKKKKKKLGIEF